MIIFFWKHYIGCKFVQVCIYVLVRGNAQNSNFKAKAEGEIGQGEIGGGELEEELDRGEID
jgi:hypothetical protein